MLILRTLWRAMRRDSAIATADRSASLSKNPGDWDPSSQNGVLLRCVFFYLGCVSFNPGVSGKAERARRGPETVSGDGLIRGARQPRTGPGQVPKTEIEHPASR